MNAPFLLISRSVEFESRLRELLGGRLSVVPGAFVTFGASAVADQVEGAPKAVLLGPVLNFDETHALAETLTERYPDLAIVVVREQRSDLEDWVDELRLHAVVSPLASDEELKEVLGGVARWLVVNELATAEEFRPRTVSEDQSNAFDEYLADEAPVESEVEEGGAGQAPDPEPQPDAPAWEFPPLEAGVPTEAIAVVAPKGGQGKTTIAVNLAAGLAKAAPNSVVLVDADLQFGDITAALNLDPQRTIVDAVADSSLDEIVLKTTLTHHDGGFFVVASAPSPEFADQIQPGVLGGLIERLRGFFRYVVIDTTPGLGEHSLVAIEHVTDAVFVSNMGVPALRALRTELGMLRELGLEPANRHIVVNQTDRFSGLTLKDAEQIIGAPIDVEVPRTSAVLLASNRGVPLLEDDPRDAAAKAIRSLVARVLPAPSNPPRSMRRRRSYEPA
jgi:MinD-like ATPase involved in chromosome partitioning or flagellar assembly